MLNDFQNGVIGFDTTRTEILTTLQLNTKNIILCKCSFILNNLLKEIFVKNICKER